MAAGVSVYAGWSDEVTASASDRAGEFLIDRMLGTNASTIEPIESPKQRPFDITLLKQDMNNRGIDVDPDPPPAELIITKLQDSFELLAPSLRFVQVINMTDTLFLTGYFGSDPGSKGHVYIDGVEQTIYKWEPQFIWASIPRTGPGSAGPVVVEREGDADLTPLTDRKSNPVNLTDWNVTFTYRHNDAGTLKGFIVVHAHIRADVHAFREFPHATPQVNPFLVFSGVFNSDGTTWAEGFFEYPVPDSDPQEVLTWTWAGLTHLDWRDTLNTEGIMIQGRIYEANKRMELFLNVLAASGLTETIVSSINGPVGNSDLVFLPPLEVYDGTQFQPFTLFIDFDTNWGITAGGRNFFTCCSVDPDNDGTINDVTHSWEWSNTAPTFSPDANAPR